jgi:hypothetical protein
MCCLYMARKEGIMPWKEEKCVQFVVEHLQRIHRQEDQDVDGRVVTKLITQK